MKIIRPSNMPWVGQHTCPKCNCVFELTEEDVGLVTETKARSFRYGDGIDGHAWLPDAKSKIEWDVIRTLWVIPCPNCAAEVKVHEECHMGTPEELNAVRKLDGVVWINNRRVYEVPEEKSVKSPIIRARHSDRSGLQCPLCGGPGLMSNCAISFREGCHMCGWEFYSIKLVMPRDQMILDQLRAEPAVWRQEKPCLYEPNTIVYEEFLNAENLRIRESSIQRR